MKDKIKRKEVKATLKENAQNVSFFFSHATTENAAF